MYGLAYQDADTDYYSLLVFKTRGRATLALKSMNYMSEEITELDDEVYANIEEIIENADFEVFRLPHEELSELVVLNSSKGAIVAKLINPLEESIPHI